MLRLLPVALLPLLLNTSCLKFQESALDSTSSGIIVPALLSLSTPVSISGVLRDRTGALVTSTALIFTSVSTLSSAVERFSSTMSTATVNDTSDTVGRFSATLTSGTHTLTFTFNSFTYTLTFTVNADGTSSAVSIDGSSFASDSPVSAGSFMAVAVGNDGGCVAYYSADLSNWTAVALPSSIYTCATIRDVIYADGVFVAVGEDGSGMPQCYIAVSSDGISWTQKACSAGLDTGLYSVAFGNGVFMAVGIPNGGAPTVRIGDAQAANWSTANTGLNIQAYGPAYYNGSMFFTGMRSGAGNPELHNSAAPATTTFTQTDGVNCSLLSGGVSFQDISGGSGQNFLAISNDASNTGLFYSPYTNPVCTVTTIFGASAANARASAYDPYNGNYVAVGTGCLSEASTSPTTWGGSGQFMSTGGECAPTIDWHKVIFSKTKKQFIAVGVQTTNLDPYVAVSSSGAQNDWTFTLIFNAASGATPISIAIRE